MIRTCRAVTFPQLKASLSIQLVYNSMTAMPSVASAKMMYSQRTLLLLDLEFKLLPFLNTEQRQPSFSNSAVYILRHSDLWRQRGDGRVGRPNWPFLINADDTQADTEVIRPFSSKWIWIKINQEWLCICSLSVPAWWSTLGQPWIDPVILDVS